MGTLYLVATPIGNLEDITIRAIKTLFKVDYIACEDTRRTGQLLVHLYNTYNSYYGVNYLNLHHNTYQKKPTLISFYDEVEFEKVPQIINLLTAGNDVALVSDAGTPLISDPGYKLVRSCIAKNIPLVSIPGPSSVTMALTLSGLPVNNFWFLGFLPKTKNSRLKLFLDLTQDLKNIKQRPTLIFFESPLRIAESLEDSKSVFGNIDIAVGRELTKIHEEVVRGKISEVSEKIKSAKGELVILLNY